MAFQTGHKKVGGRKMGVANKATVAAKTAFQLAFEQLGGVDALTSWAQLNPSDFYRLYGRLIPIDMSGDISNEHHGSIDLNTQKFLDILTLEQLEQLEEKARHAIEASS